MGIIYLIIGILIFSGILFLIGLWINKYDEPFDFIIPDEIEQDQDLEDPKMCKFFLCTNYASNTGLVPSLCDKCLHKKYEL